MDSLSLSREVVVRLLFVVEKKEYVSFFGDVLDVMWFFFQLIIYIVFDN